MGSQCSPKMLIANTPELRMHSFVKLSWFMETATVAGEEVICIAELAVHPVGFPSFQVVTT